MEFKFRAVDDRPPIPTSELSAPSIPASSSQGCFSLHAPEGDRNPEAERLQRETEKKRIKEEIIAWGIERRRALEAEVLRELQVEGFNLGFEASAPSLPPSVFNHSMHQQQQQTVACNGEERFRVPGSNKETSIVQEKPNPSHCGEKRRAETLPEVPLLPLAGVKKPNEEWSCALCHVSTCSEKALNGHLGGKKHRAKEAALRAEKACTTRLVANKPAKLSKLSPKAVGSEHNAKGKVITPAIGANASGAEAEMKVDEQVGRKTEESPLQCGKSLQEKNGAMKKERKSGFQREKKFKFWCETCKVGAYAQSVMESHLGGKKHLSVVSKQSQSKKTVTDISMPGLSAGGENEAGTTTGKTDGSIVQEVRQVVVQDVSENEKVEAAASNESIVKEAANAEHLKAVQEADTRKGPTCF